MFKPLIDFIKKNKGTGTTEALIEAAESKKGWLVVATASEAARRAAEMPEIHVISMENLCDEEARWIWEKEGQGPMFIDPKAISWLVEFVEKAKNEGKED